MIRAVHHFSFTVKDLEQSLDFYVGVLGMQIISDTTVQESTDHSVTQIDNAKLRIVHLEAFGQVIELIEYLSPIGKSLDTRTCDVGSAHIAFRVDDLSQTYEELLSRNVRFKSQPVVTGASPGKIIKSVYFLDPDGITLELVEIGT